MDGDRAAEGDGDVGDVGRSLQEHSALTSRELGSTLQRYFDPSSGELSQRLRTFSEDSGPVASLLAKYVAPDTSVLSETLRKSVGEHSVLFQKLDPARADGFFASVKGEVEKIVLEQRKAIERAMDPSEEGAPVRRFLHALEQTLDAKEKSRDAQIEAAFSALDLNNENSALTRLMRETHQAKQTLLTAVNPEAPDSPFAMLRQSLMQLIQRASEEQASVLRQDAETRLVRDQTILDAITRLDTRKQAEALTPKAGVKFEEEVFRFLSEEIPEGHYVIESVGNTVGLRPNSKKGDVVIRSFEESDRAGDAISAKIRIVVEAKRDTSYTTAKALEELNLGRQNRSCSVGLFVMSCSHAPMFARYGNDLLVQWNDEDRTSDAYLQAAIFCALSMASNGAKQENSEEADELLRIEQRLESEVARLGKLQKVANSIRTHASTIDDEVTLAMNKLRAIAEDAKRWVARAIPAAPEAPVQLSSRRKRNASLPLFPVDEIPTLTSSTKEETG